MATLKSIPACDAGTSEIQQLTDNPNESGLDANALKEKFDQNATNLKNWLNGGETPQEGPIRRINDNFQALNDDSSTLNGKIGDLDNLNTTSKSNVVSAINEVNTNMSTNKVLWTGGYYMTQMHTIYFTENGTNTTISAQKNGIVLVWSAYQNGQPSDSNFNFTFIPKQYVTLKGGYGVTSIMTGTQGSPIASKYVYVHDDHITGNDRNGTSTAVNYVLRYVIGV